MNILLAIPIIVILALFIFLMHRENKLFRNARAGLDVIENSTMSPGAKMALLMLWTSPQQSDESLAYLKREIARFEEQSKKEGATE